MLLSCDWLPLPSSSATYVPWLQINVNKWLWSYAAQWSSPWAHASASSGVPSLWPSLVHLRKRRPWERSRSNTRYLSMRAKSLIVHDDVTRKHIAHALWAGGRRIASYIKYIHTYIHRYIHRYSEFAICYSCIRGSLRLAPNNRNMCSYWTSWASHDISMWFKFPQSWNLPDQRKKYLYTTETTY